MLQFDKIYHYLQQHPNEMVHIHDIATGCDLPFREVEKIFFSGRLGLAGTQIAYNCQMCDVGITPSNKGRRRLCAQCSIKLEIEGKLHLTHEEDEIDGIGAKEKKGTLSRSDEEYEAALALKKAEAQAKASEGRNKDNDHSYGFKRLSSK